jgi:WD40 repeat protein
MVEVPFYVWDVSSISTGQPISRTLYGHKYGVTQIDLSPDGSTLASCSWDDTVRLWDAGTWETTSVISVTGAVNLISVQFSPDGQILAAGTQSGLIYLWDAHTLQPIGQPFRGHTVSITGLSFSPDGKILASGDFDAIIRLWDVETGKPLGQPLIGHTPMYAMVAFHPDGKTLASSGFDGTIRLWDVDPASWRMRACELAGRNLTQAEWATYLTGLPYSRTCDGWPAGE